MSPFSSPTSNPGALTCLESFDVLCSVIRSNINSEWRGSTSTSHPSDVPRSVLFEILTSCYPCASLSRCALTLYLLFNNSSNQFRSGNFPWQHVVVPVDQGVNSARKVVNNCCVAAALDEPDILEVCGQCLLAILCRASDSIETHVSSPHPTFLRCLVFWWSFQKQYPQRWRLN